MLKEAWMHLSEYSLKDTPAEDEAMYITFRVILLKLPDDTKIPSCPLKLMVLEVMALSVIYPGRRGDNSQIIPIAKPISY